MKYILKKSFICIFTLAMHIGCGQVKKQTDVVTDLFVDKKNPNEIVGLLSPKWFSSNQGSGVFDRNGVPPIHLFFDAVPRIDYKNSTASFIVQTPKVSPLSFRLDKLTGQHYANQKYCQQEDIHKKYPGSIYLPPMTIGHIPRVLDQLGGMQKIIVFGNGKKHAEDFRKNIFDARLLGGFIEQECSLSQCFNAKDWKSRLVLVGVDKEDKEFSNINLLSELKNKVEWELVQAFIENGQGVNQVGSLRAPAFRYGAEMSTYEALQYLKKNSIMIKNSKLVSVRNSCHKLYNLIWDKIYKDSKFEQSVKKRQNIDWVLKKIKNKNITNQDLYFTRFTNGFKRYQDQFKTCMDYIYPTNVNQEPEKHWFFSYFMAIHNVHRLGYTFNCKTGQWVSDLNIQKKRRTKLMDEFRGCTSAAIDSIGPRAVKLLDRLRMEGQKSFRYITYDSTSVGSHQRIYSWVEDSGRVLNCGDKYQSLLKVKTTFPKDVSWGEKKLDIDLKRNLKK